MELELASPNLEDYLKEIPPVIQFSTPAIRQKIKWIIPQSSHREVQARLAFEVARDEIAHSFDTGNPQITIGAEEVLENKNGICFAKAHLLASLLRGLKIPCGFCYQRVLRKPTDPQSGFALHGLNALHLEGKGWFRVDPRGNKPGVDAQFSIASEQLAYPIRPELGEIDYPNVFTQPLPSVIQAMLAAQNTQDLFFKRPEAIDFPHLNA